MDSTTVAIVRQIESLGYVVKIFRINDTVEMHAMAITEDKDHHVARCNDGDGEPEAYRAACLLAIAVGIEIDDA